jgi:hypothetical protein
MEKERSRWIQKILEPFSYRDDSILSVFFSLKSFYPCLPVNPQAGRWADLLDV